ncbi:hypothetical protein EP331_06475 [bacterium]|nr:MAG: hypothetical protein EP331_06475 [bacterium]
MKSIQMRNVLLLLALIIAAISACTKDKTVHLNPDLRYFRFSSCSVDTHGNWQDTSFVAATANQNVILKITQQLAKPYQERDLFPLGKLAAGSGGYNTNATHHFSWHFVEDDWDMVEMGIEIYDGCAYSDAELANYQGTIERYGGWGNRVIEELQLN